jgi:hypothetical protein
MQFMTLQNTQWQTPPCHALEDLGKHSMGGNFQEQWQLLQ